MLYRTKVLIAIPILLVGGTEVQTLSLVRVLIKNGYQVIVCCYFEYDTSMVSRMEKTGADVLLMKFDRTEGIIALILKLKKLFIELHPDIVHVQYVAPGFLPIIAARLTKIPTIFATVHQPGRVYGWKAKLLLRTAAGLCTAFFCNSKSVEESWFGDSEIFDIGNIGHKRKHFTIYNAIDVDHIEQIIKDSNPQQIRNNLGLNDKSIIGIVGRLRWEKGQDILLDAMPEIIREIQNAILLVVGDGPDKEKLKVKAKELGIENHVIWMGQLDHDEVIKLYTVMDVVVIPSRFEGFGLSAAEAMGAGRLVIGSQVDGLKEIIKDKVNGYLFPVDDSKRLAIELIDLLSNKQKAFHVGERGHDNIKKNFSIEKFASSITSAYHHFYK
jgi:L-malate glycosyltransferase